MIRCISWSRCVKATSHSAVWDTDSVIRCLCVTGSNRSCGSGVSVCVSLNLRKDAMNYLLAQHVYHENMEAWVLNRLSWFRCWWETCSQQGEMDPGDHCGKWLKRIFQAFSNCRDNDSLWSAFSTSVRRLLQFLIKFILTSVPSFRN